MKPKPFKRLLFLLLPLVAACQSRGFAPPEPQAQVKDNPATSFLTGVDHFNLQGVEIVVDEPGHLNPAERRSLRGRLFGKGRDAERNARDLVLAGLRRFATDTFGEKSFYFSQIEYLGSKKVRNEAFQFRLVENTEKRMAARVDIRLAVRNLAPPLTRVSLQFTRRMEPNLVPQLEKSVATVARAFHNRLRMVPYGKDVSAREARDMGVRSFVDVVSGARLVFNEEMSRSVDVSEEEVNRTTVRVEDPVSGRVLTTDDPRWHLRQTGILEAWQSLWQKTQSPVSAELDEEELSLWAVNHAGKGVLVAHPDTGYLCHPSFCDDSGADGPLGPFLNKDYRRNFVGDPKRGVARLLADQGRDVVNGALRMNHGHGTRTASLIFGRKQTKQSLVAQFFAPADPESPTQLQYPGVDSPMWVYGGVPAASYLPLRVGQSVVLGTPGAIGNLADAIDEARKNGAHVVSISLGGLPSRKLRNAVRSAADAGMIVVAAAGNGLPLTFWPARYSETIAVAACTADGRPWRATGRGAAIDICAPGDNVWHARPNFVFDRSQIKDDRNIPNLIFDSARGGGTSMATAVVAAAATLWLQHHSDAQGVDAFLGRFQALRKDVEKNLKRDIRVVDLFRCHLTASAVQPKKSSWNSFLFGEGLLNVGHVKGERPSLLSLPMPQNAFEFNEQCPS